MPSKVSSLQWPSSRVPSAGTSSASLSDISLAHKFERLGFLRVDMTRILECHQSKRKACGCGRCRYPISISFNVERGVDISILVPRMKFAATWNGLVEDRRVV